MQRSAVLALVVLVVLVVPVAAVKAEKVLRRAKVLQPLQRPRAGAWRALLSGGRSLAGSMVASCWERRLLPRRWPRSPATLWQRLQALLLLLPALARLQRRSRRQWHQRRPWRASCL